VFLSKGEALRKINDFSIVMEHGQIMVAVPKNEQGKGMCLAYYTKRRLLRGLHLLGGVWHIEQ
jgi:hypothetical protein